MKKLLLFLICVLSSLLINAQAPAFQWAKQLASDNYTYGTNIARDAFGDIVTAGYFTGTGNFDVAASNFTLNSADGISFVTRHNANGNFMWAKQFGNNVTYIQSLNIDAAGYIYVTGSFSGVADMDPGTAVNNFTSAGNQDAFVLKLDPSGNFMWAKQFGAANQDGARAMDIDANGNLYLTGLFTNTVDMDPGPASFTLSTLNGGYDMFVSKLDGNGNFVWAKAVNGTFIELARALKVDVSGNVYVTGVVAGKVDFDPGAGVDTLTTDGDNSFVLKLNNSGNYQWAKIFGSQSASGCAFDICIDATGSVYTTGDFGGTVDFDPGAGTSTITSVGTVDVFISKLNAAGNFVWAKSIAHGVQFGGGNVDVDNLGNVYATGQFTATTDFDTGAGTYTLSPNNSRAGFILKLNSSGNFVWALRTGDPGAVAAKATIIDGQGTIYIMGVFSSASDFDHTTGINTLTPLGTMDTFILKLAQPTSGINEISSGLHVSVYPNPGAAVLNIFIEHTSEVTSLSICDALGKIILEKNVTNNTTQIDIQNLNAGIYYLNILNNTTIVGSKKIIKQ